MPSGAGRRRPVSTGDSKAVRELLGEGSGASSTPSDDFDLPPGFENRYAADRRNRTAERRANAETRQYSARQAAGTAGPGPAGGGGARGARGAPGRPSRRSSPSRSSGSLGIRRAARQASVANPTAGRLPIGLTAGAGVAGLFFGAVSYALVLSVVDYGPTGPLLWFKAKFLNQAAGSPGSSPPSSSPPSSAGSPPPTFHAVPPGTPYKASPGPGV